MHDPQRHHMTGSEGYHDMRADRSGHGIEQRAAVHGLGPRLGLGKRDGMTLQSVVATIEPQPSALITHEAVEDRRGKAELLGSRLALLGVLERRQFGEAGGFRLRGPLLPVFLPPLPRARLPL